MLFYVFDLLHHAGQSLVTVPNLKRRERLLDLRLTEGVVRTPPHYHDLSGTDMLAVARDNGLEGVL